MRCKFCKEKFSLKEGFNPDFCCIECCIAYYPKRRPKHGKTDTRGSLGKFKARYFL